MQDFAGPPPKDCQHSSVKAPKLQSLVWQAIKILQEPDAQAKAEQTHAVARLWKQKQLTAGPIDSVTVPSRPGRDDSRVTVVAPGKMPSLGKGGSLASRQAILHSLAHIESWAVDLSWDIVARFSQDSLYSLPNAFADDFVRVADDEASHFQQLQQRLEAVGSFYGALPVHDGLWESAEATAHSLPARLAVESCVHEARGLDRLPHTIRRFRSSGDQETARLLEQIYQEEIAHCAAGVRWLSYLHKQAVAASNTQRRLSAQHLQTIDLSRHSLVQHVEARPCGQEGLRQPSGADNAVRAATGQVGHCGSSHNCHRKSGNFQVAMSPETAHSLGQHSEQAAGKSAACSSQESVGNSHQQAVPATKDSQAPNSPSKDADPCQQAASGHPEPVSGAGQCSAEAGSHAAAKLHHWQADAAQYGSVEQWFHALVRAHFKGSLKPPFNEAAREAAGFGPGWYQPLSSQVLR